MSNSREKLEFQGKPGRKGIKAMKKEDVLLSQKRKLKRSEDFPGGSSLDTDQKKQIEPPKKEKKKKSDYSLEHLEDCQKSLERKLEEQKELIRKNNEAKEALDSRYYKMAIPLKIKKENVDLETMDINDPKYGLDEEAKTFYDLLQKELKRVNREMENFYDTFSREDKKTLNPVELPKAFPKNIPAKALSKSRYEEAERKLEKAGEGIKDVEPVSIDQPKEVGNNGKKYAEIEKEKDENMRALGDFVHEFKGKYIPNELYINKETREAIKIVDYDEEINEVYFLKMEDRKRFHKPGWELDEFMKDYELAAKLNGRIKNKKETGSIGDPLKKKELVVEPEEKPAGALLSQKEIKKTISDNQPESGIEQPKRTFEQLLEHVEELAKNRRLFIEKETNIENLTSRNCYIHVERLSTNGIKDAELEKFYKYVEGKNKENIQLMEKKIKELKESVRLSESEFYTKFNIEKRKVYYKDGKKNIKDNFFVNDFNEKRQEVTLYEGLKGTLRTKMPVSEFQKRLESEWKNYKALEEKEPATKTVKNKPPVLEPEEIEALHKSIRGDENEQEKAISPDDFEKITVISKNLLEKMRLKAEEISYSQGKRRDAILRNILGDYLESKLKETYKELKQDEMENIAEDILNKIMS